jgi:hypothetical protein
METWQPGHQIALRGIVHKRVWIAHSVTIVQDKPELLIAYLEPGAPCKIPEGLIGRKYSGAANGRSRWDEQDSGDWQLADWIWEHRRALILMPPARYYAVYLFWSGENEIFEGWYVNFQMPFKKTPWSIDTLDLEIDLIIRPDGSWQWKDEAEYLAGVQRGSISADVAGGVAKAREEILHLFTAGSPLFDRRWLSWKPDPNWGIPALPTEWHVVEPHADEKVL